MQVWLSAKGAKTFPGPSYASSEDGVVWLWHLLINLYSFFFHEHSRFTGHQKKGKGFSLTPHYHFHPLHRHLDISRAITVGSLPLHIASSQTQYIYTKWVLWVLLTLLRKKENALIIRSAMETLKYGIIRLSEVSSFYHYALFRKFRTPFDLEPATPLSFLIT